MDLKHLEYVIELARTRSLTQAAANLGVAQPAISQAITGLERQFAVTLFDRASRPVQATPAGAMFIEQAARVLDEMKRLHGVANEHATLTRGRLTIGTTYWVGETILPALVTDFHKLFPGINFVLRREPLSKLVEAVRSGEFDVAFVDMLKTPKLAGLECHTFHIDEIVVIVPPGHSLAQRAIIRLEELGEEPFIGYETESSIYAPFTRAAKAAGYLPHVVASSQSQAIVRSLVSNGMGVSVGSKTFLEGPGQPIEMVPLLPSLTKDTMIILKAGSGPNPSTRPFVDFVRERLSVADERRPVSVARAETNRPAS